MKKPPTNIGASVRARLLRLSTERREDFQLLLTRYANERLLYRLTKSPHGSQFVLKGAALFTLWTGRAHRATRDLDLLGFGDATEANVRSVFEEILKVDVPDDGVVFDVGSLTVGPIRKDQQYGGVRATMNATVTNARVRLQVDVGFGDAITPAAKLVEFPALLDFPAPKLRAYPRETVVAEKLEAMVQLGMANSRMKDFFDIVALSRTFEFDGDLLARAIRATFERRGTALPDGPPVAFTSTFAEDETKQAQWKAFLRKSGATSEAEPLESAVAMVSSFLTHPMAIALAPSASRSRWRAGTWIASEPL
jgi:predicted nucleotidyltransferase component of viral defense system